ncbi:hypothetical protein MMC31_002628 [Peltigera leucophlebia]|nr:hypothetical protein [Peltigera leucophlebia]
MDHSEAAFLKAEKRVGMDLDKFRTVETKAGMEDILGGYKGAIILGSRPGREEIHSLPYTKVYNDYWLRVDIARCNSIVIGNSDILFGQTPRPYHLNRAIHSFFEAQSKGGHGTLLAGFTAGRSVRGGRGFALRDHYPIESPSREKFKDSTTQETRRYTQVLRGQISPKSNHVSSHFITNSRATAVGWLQAHRSCHHLWPSWRKRSCHNLQKVFIQSSSLTSSTSLASSMADSIEVYNLPEAKLKVPAADTFKEFTFTDEIRKAVETRD